MIFQQKQKRKTNIDLEKFCYVYKYYEQARIGENSLFKVG